MKTVCVTLAGNKVVSYDQFLVFLLIQSVFFQVWMVTKGGLVKYDIQTKGHTEYKLNANLSVSGQLKNFPFFFALVKTHRLCRAFVS